MNDKNTSMEQKVLTFNQNSNPDDHDSEYQDFVKVVHLSDFAKPLDIFVNFCQDCLFLK